MKHAALLSAFGVFAAACGSSPPPATPVPPQSSAKTPVTAPASRDSLFLEVVTIERKWVAKFAPDEAKDAKAWSDDAAKKLAAEMTKRLRNSPDTREAIADSVQQVLGDLAAADPNRPKMSVLERERIKDVKHLSAAVKAGLGQFADHAHPGDVLDTPASDEEAVVVARAVPARR
jgi:hypothetical protein